MTKTQVLHEALALPPEDQLEVAQLLWDQNAPGEDFFVSPELRTELERRLGEAQEHPETSIPWDEVKRRCWPGL